VLKTSGYWISHKDGRIQNQDSKPTTTSKPRCSFLHDYLAFLLLLPKYPKQVSPGEGCCGWELTESGGWRLRGGGSGRWSSVCCHAAPDCTQDPTFSTIKLLAFYLAVLGIRDILVRIRIQGSVPLTNGYRYNSRGIRTSD